MGFEDRRANPADALDADEQAHLERIRKSLTQEERLRRLEDRDALLGPQLVARQVLQGQALERIEGDLKDALVLLGQPEQIVHDEHSDAPPRVIPATGLHRRFDDVDQMNRGLIELVGEPSKKLDPRASRPDAAPEEQPATGIFEVLEKAQSMADQALTAKTPQARARAWVQVAILLLFAIGALYAMMKGLK
jgi:hypothetical protein